MTSEQVQDVVDDRFTAVIYCRVSTDDHGQSNDTQERLCRDWCEKNSIRVLEIYTDEMSGSTPNRPGLAMMLNRIQFQQDADFIVAYDQSRITRADDFEQIKAMVSPYRCRIRLVRMDLDLDSLSGQITQDVMSRVNKEENRVRNEKTHLALETKKREGFHVGRPARFLFAEDIDSKPRGCFREGVTLVIPEDLMYSYAEKGYSINYAAEKILGIDAHVVMREMRLADPSNPKCRNKGLVDRFSKYMELYEASKGAYKPSGVQTVGNPAELGVQRVVSP